MDSQAQTARQQLDAAITAAQQDPENAAKQPIKGLSLEKENLNSADWANLAFEDCKFNGASLKRSKLDGATFTRCEFRLSDLTDANLNGAAFQGKCDFENATLIRARATDAQFKQANLRDCDAKDAVFVGADFKDAILAGARFDGADLRSAQNLLLDGTFIQNAQFSPHASDSWSVLRRTYTGPRFLLNLLFPAVFIISLAAKSYGLWALALLQQTALGTNGNPCIEIGSHCERVAIWEIVTGWHAGLAAGLFASASLAYNVLRLFMTLTVAGMRDAEERNGQSPMRKGTSTLFHWKFGYERLGQRHHILQLFQWATFALSIAGWWQLLATDVIVPKLG